MLNTNIISVSNYGPDENLIILTRKDSLSWAESILSANELAVLTKMATDEAPYAIFNSGGRWVIVEFVSEKADADFRA